MIRIIIFSIIFTLLSVAPGSGIVADGRADQGIQVVKSNDDVNVMKERAIEFFTRKIPQEFEYRLNNSYKYIDLVKTVFGEKGIPHEIAYLPLIESGFSPVSVGPGDAAGMWQFVRTTARKYGLRVDTYVDERKDPVKSTHAAAEYLADLYSVFGRWDIVLAAYKAGEGRIKRIMAGRSDEEVPSIFSNYIGRVFAVFDMAESPEKYGFRPSGRDETSESMEVTSTIKTSLGKVAAQYNTSVRTIRELNPALLRDETPPYHYVIKVPAQ